MPKIRYTAHHFGIQPGTIVQESEANAKKMVADGKAIAVPDSTPTTAEREQAAANGDPVAEAPATAPARKAATSTK